MLEKRKYVFVVYDNSVADFAGKLCEEWDDREDIVVMNRLGIDADEAHKTLHTVEDICRWLMESGADRASFLVAIGGGVVTDIVGFAAGIYMRGIRYYSVPTTLLAQIDAAIGGKVASNLDTVKNVLGLFHNPEKVLIFTEPLETLPVKEWHSGAAEMLKTFLIADPIAYHEAVEVFSTLEQEHYSTFAKDAVSDVLTSLISRAGKIKRRIVRKDPFDRSSRMVLNLGHSYGHAIEWWQSQPGCPIWDKYSHGEAVAIGIIQAARLSAAQGMADESLPAAIERDFKACGLPTELPCDRSELAPAFKVDKKNEDNGIQFVFLRGIGRAVVKKRDISFVLR